MGIVSDWCSVMKQRVERHSAVRSGLVRSGYSRSAYSRSGFTLVELIVSIGVLSILLTIAGSVFTLTLRSSGQANALIEVSEQIRVFEETLREELRNIQPGRSIMIIQPNPIHGIWRKSELDALREGADIDPRSVLNPQLANFRDPEREQIVVDGSGNPALVRQMPRADTLAFFTDLPANSYRDPEISGQKQFVVYAHAELGELDPLNGAWQTPLVVTGDPLTWDFDSFGFGDPVFRFNPPTGGNERGRYVMTDAPAPTGGNGAVFLAAAAEEWHLARRSVLIVDRNLASPPYFPIENLNDSADVFGTADDNEQVYSSLDKVNYIRDGRRDYIVNGSANFDYDLDVANRIPNPEFDAPVLATGGVDPGALSTWIGRSQLSTLPTASQARRMGANFMPRCASFKVEWALDLGDLEFGELRGTTLPGASEPIWIDPANIVTTIESIQTAYDDYVDNVCASLACESQVGGIRDDILDKLAPRDASLNPSTMVPAQCLEGHGTTRFIDPGETGSTAPAVRSTHIFYARKPEPTCFAKYRDPSTGEMLGGIPEPPERPDPLFPRALRITIDVADPVGRLERPIRHVMILPVGQE
jgi:prepilin-type N-terminal cleavage/methylation domain-containing protein